MLFFAYLIFSGSTIAQPSDLFVRNAKHRKCVVNIDELKKRCSFSGTSSLKETLRIGGGVMTALNYTEEMVTWCGRCKCNQATSLSKRVRLEFVYIRQGECTVCSGPVCRLDYRPLPTVTTDRTASERSSLLSLILLLMLCLTYWAYTLS